MSFLGKLGQHLVDGNFVARMIKYDESLGDALKGALEEKVKVGADIAQSIFGGESLYEKITGKEVPESGLFSATKAGYSLAQKALELFQ